MPPLPDRTVFLKDEKKISRSHRWLIYSESMLHNHEDWSLDPSTHVWRQASWEYLTPEKMTVRRMIARLFWLPASRGNSSKVQGETLFLKNRQRMIKGYIIFSFGLSSINRHCTCTFMSLHVHHTCASHIWVPPKVKKKQIGLFFKRKFKRRCCLFCFSNANYLRDER